MAEVNIRVTGTDNASQVFEKNRKEVQNLGSSVREAQQIFGGLTDQIVNRLAPGLGQATNAIGQIAREVRNLPAGFQVAAIAITAATAALGQFIDAFNRAQQFQVQLGINVAARDFGALTSQVQENSRALREYQNLLDRAGESVRFNLLNPLKSLEEFAGKGIAALQAFRTPIEAIRKEAEQLNQAFSVLYQGQQQATRFQIQGQQAATERQRAQTRLGVAQELFGQTLSETSESTINLENANIRAAIRAQFKAELDAARQAFLNERAKINAIESLDSDIRSGAIQDAERTFNLRSADIGDRQAAALEAQQASERTAQRQRDVDVLRQQIKFEQELLDIRIALLEAQKQDDSIRGEGRFARDIQLQQNIIELQRQRASLDVRFALNFGRPGDLEAAQARLGGVTQRGEIAVNQLGLGNLERSIGVDIQGVGVRQRELEVMRQVATFTEEERLDREIMLSFEREILINKKAQFEIENSRADLDKIALANEERRVELLGEAVKRANLAQAERERTDPALGFQKGLAQAQREFESFGQHFQDIAREIASAGQRQFSDLFFNVLTLNFKELPNVGAQFGRQMVRLISDELAKITVAPILANIRAAFGGGGGGGGLGGLINLGGAGPSQAPVAQTPAIGAAGAGGIPGAIGIGSASPSQIAEYQAKGYAIVNTSQGPAAVPGQGVFASALNGVVSFLNTPISNLFTSRTNINVRQPGPAGSQPVATTQEQAAFFEANQVDYIPATSGVSGGGATVAQGIGAGVQAAAFAYQVYTSLNNPQQNPTSESVISGTVGGASVGYNVGSLFGGYGGAIGAAIGAIIGFATSSKTGDQVKKDARRRKRLKDAAKMLQEMFDAINGAIDREDAAAVKLESGNTVGGVIYSIALHNQAGDFSGFGWGPVEVAKSVIEWMYDNRVQPEEAQMREISGTVELVINFAGTTTEKGRPRPDPVRSMDAAEALLEAFDKKRSQAFLEYSENVSGEFVPTSSGSGRRVTRQTVLNVERYKEAVGQEISLIQESIANMSDEVLQRLLIRLGAIDRDHAIGLIAIEGTPGGEQVRMQGSLGQWSISFPTGPALTTGPGGIQIPSLARPGLGAGTGVGPISGTVRPTIYENP